MEKCPIKQLSNNISEFCYIMKKEKITKPKIDFLEWITCPHCKKLIFSGQPEMVGALLRWKKQNDKKIKKIFGKKS